MSDEQKKDQNVSSSETATESTATDAKAAPVVDVAPTETSEEVEVPSEFKDLVEKVEKMTVLELSQLVKILEKKFGVSAVAVAAPAQGGGEAAEEKTDFTVHLADAGAQKIAVIKVVKEVAALGLKEAKELVDGAPADVKTNVKKEEAEEIKAKLEEAGAKAELK